MVESGQPNDPIRITVIDLDHGTYRWVGKMPWSFAMTMATTMDKNMPAYESAVTDSLIYGHGMVQMSGSDFRARHIPVRERNA